MRKRPPGDPVVGRADRQRGQMLPVGYKHHFDKAIQWYAVYARQANHKPARHYLDLGSRGHGITTDCKDASGVPGLVGPALLHRHALQAVIGGWCKLLKQFARRYGNEAGSKTPAFLCPEQIQLKQFLPALLAMAIVCLRLRWRVHLSGRRTRYTRWETTYTWEELEKNSRQSPNCASNANRRRQPAGPRASGVHHDKLLRRVPQRGRAVQCTAGLGA